MADEVTTNSHTKVLKTVMPWPRACLVNTMHIEVYGCLGIVEEQYSGALG